MKGDQEFCDKLESIDFNAIDKEDVKNTAEISDSGEVNEIEGEELKNDGEDEIEGLEMDNNELNQQGSSKINNKEKVTTKDTAGKENRDNDSNVEQQEKQKEEVGILIGEAILDEDLFNKIIGDSNGIDKEEKKRVIKNYVKKYFKTDILDNEFEREEAQENLKELFKKELTTITDNNAEQKAEKIVKKIYGEEE